MRALCLALPEAREKITWETPTYRVREKMFALCGAGRGRLALTVKAPPGAQEALVAYAPERYFVPAYVGKAGWIGQSWRLVAPKRLAAKLPRAEDD